MGEKESGPVFVHAGSSCGGSRSVGLVREAGLAGVGLRACGDLEASLVDVVDLQVLVGDGATSGQRCSAGLAGWHGLGRTQEGAGVSCAVAVLGAGEGDWADGVQGDGAPVRRVLAGLAGPSVCSASIGLSSRLLELGGGVLREVAGRGGRGVGEAGA